MRRYLPILILFLHPFFGVSQQLTGPQLLEKAIAYHDPNGVWKKFKGNFLVTMQQPDAADRLSEISIDFPKNQFFMKVTKEGDSYSFIVEKDSCEITLNGSSSISKKEAEHYRLSCERGRMYKNYYTYLYGLPMKLKNPGTLLDEKVVRRTFKGKEYLVLKVNYDKEVGKDTWYFYFDPTTYAMKVYQFYHDESKNDGEYILLDGIEEIKGIKMPKTRAWYYNKDDKYLGTDILKK